MSRKRPKAVPNTRADPEREARAASARTEEAGDRERAPPRARPSGRPAKGIATPRRFKNGDGIGTPRQLRVRMFGSITVESGSRRLTARGFGGVKPKQIFEILLCARGHPVPKDRLGDLLWGEKPPRNLTGCLESYVSVLRHALGPLGHQLIVTEPSAYRFAVEHADIDLDRFDELVKRAARPDAREARQWLEEALALVQGQVLEDEPYAAWAEELRSAYRAKVQQTRLDAAEAALADRDFRGAHAHAEASIEWDPFDERGCRVAMLGLYSLGLQYQALEAFTRCRTTLNVELGIEPVHETKALHTAILRQVDPEELLPQVRGETRAAGGSGRAPLAGNGHSEESSALTSLIRRAAAGQALVRAGDGDGLRVFAELLCGLPGTRVGWARCSHLAPDLPSVLVKAVQQALNGAVESAASRRPKSRARGPAQGTSSAGAIDWVIASIRRHAPLVLILEDLNEADPKSIAALDDVLGDCKGVPVSVIGTCRFEELGPDHPLRRLPATASIQLGETSVLVLAQNQRARLLGLAIYASLLIAIIAFADGTG